MNNSDQTSLVHPAYPMPAEVSEAFAALREESRATAERNHELARLSRPTKKERRSMAELAGVERQKPGMREIGSRYAERLQDAEAAVSPVRLLPLGLAPIDFQPIAPEPADPSFWWARTDWSLPNFYQADLRSDGLHFTGRFTYDSDPLFGFSFGATASFGIDTERLPHSPSGRWRSAPHVELFGGMRSWTGPGDLFEGDAWCKVWLIRRQTLFQWGFGASGPVLIKRGEAIEARNLIDEEDAHNSFFHPMPGFQPMPAVEFGGLFPGTVWAHLEVRFDVQLEGNSFLWMEPEVLLRTFQWPAIAL